MSLEELRKQVEQARVLEAYQDTYEQQLQLVLSRMKAAALAMVASIPKGPRDPPAKVALMRQYPVRCHRRVPKFWTH
jgi:hypothetical protein